MLISRRFRQPLMPFIKARAFSKDDYLDTVDVDSDLEEDAAPVKKVRNKKNKDSMDGLNPKQKAEALQQFYDASEKALKFKPDFSEEEKAEHYRIGRNYNIEAFKRHNRDGKDYATKIWLSAEAVKSLRPDLKAEAIIIDQQGPPKDRPWPMFVTPPIKGFRLRDYVKKTEAKSPEFSL